MKLGITIRELEGQKRKFAYGCLDWTERKYHLAGSFGSELLLHLLKVKALKKNPSDRSLSILNLDQIGLQLKLNLDNPGPLGV